MKKYEFTEETKEIFRGGKNRTLHRIRALKDLNPAQMQGKVCAGELGGFIESEDNLSYEGNCWVDENARVLQNARVIDNAYVCGEALITENVVVSEDSAVDDSSQISGNVILKGHTLVYGSSDIGGYITLGGSAEVTDVSLDTSIATIPVEGSDADSIAEAISRVTIEGFISISC